MKKVVHKPEITQGVCLECHPTNARWAHIATVVDKPREGDTPFSDLSIVAHAHLQRDDCFKCHTQPGHGSVTLHALRVNDVPTLDGKLDEEAWQKADALSVKLMGGNLIGRVTLELRAVYTDTDLYVAYRWPDPTESVEKAMWVYGPKGWEPLGVKRAGEAGNEDRVLTLWDVSIPRFQKEGCLVTCHPGVSASKFLEEPGLGDIWHWKAARSNPVGYCDDKHITNIRSGNDGGRHGDSIKLKTGTISNINNSKTGPAFMKRPLRPFGHKKEIKPQDHRFLPVEEAAPIPAGKRFQVGDRIPGYVLSVPDGSRGDIRCYGKWQSGIWTVELCRKLVTRNADDVQFEALSKPYWFAVAVSDNASGAEHSFSGILRLQCEK